jgi:hypothetical protein
VLLRNPVKRKQRYTPDRLAAKAGVRRWLVEKHDKVSNRQLA